MNTKDNQNVEKEYTPVSNGFSDPVSSVNESRRGFTRSGLAVSGVLLTLASRPVLGNSVCKTPSGFLSGNVSTHGTPVTCSGRTPGYWGTNTLSSHRWPQPYLTGTCINRKQSQDYRSWKGGTMFNDTFLGFKCIGPASALAPYSMLQVILLGGGDDTYQLGAHCVAALLNARSGLTPVLTEADIRNMYNEWATKGYFEPTAGVKWDGSQIVDYLKMTMPL